MARRWLFAAAAMAALTPLAAGAQSALPTPVETQQLESLDAWSVSALARGQGALNGDLWAHSDAAVVAALLARLPSVYESPSALRLAQRVLFSGGAAPQGDGREAARQRFEALGRMGAADQLATMAGGAGDALHDPDIAQFAAQAELARGRRPEACARGRAAALSDTAPIFLVRLRAFCSAVSGDRAAVDLALEMGHGAAAEDGWYRAALAAVAGAPGARPPGARYDNALATQISIAAHLRPAARALTNASTLALLALARGDDAPQPQRVQAAELAFRRGALPVGEARAILLATPDTVTTALAPMAATLRQVAAAQAPVEAAGAISGLLRQAAGPADFAAASRLFRAEINALRSAPDAGAALAMARAALLNGDLQDAQRLIASARQAGAEESVLAPLDAAAAASVGARGDDGTFALKRRIDAAGASMARSAARDVALLMALGARADDGARAFLAASPPTGGAAADGAATTALADAAQRGAVGETALLAALAILPRPGRLDADSLSHIIAALIAVGLENDARRLAVEAILAGQPPAAAPARRAPAH